MSTTAIARPVTNAKAAKTGKPKKPKTSKVVNAGNRAKSGKTTPDKKESKLGFIYDHVTSMVLAQLEKGVLPWNRQYNQKETEYPQNYLTKRLYTSINFMMLEMMPFELRFI